MSAFGDIWRRIWSDLRAVSGDDAYERYMEHHRRRHPDAVPLDPAQFHVTELDRRWSQVNRCC